MNEQPDQQDKSESAEQPLRHGRRPHSRQEVFLGRGNAEPDKTKLQRGQRGGQRSEEHTSELQSLMRISYAVFCLKKKKRIKNKNTIQSKKTHTYRDNENNKYVDTKHKS